MLLSDGRIVRFQSRSLRRKDAVFSTRFAPLDKSRLRKLRLRPPRVILSVVELSCLHESARRYADAESRGGFAQDDTQRYGLLNDDALTILCTDFKIGVYTFNSCLYIPDHWVQALPACLYIPDIWERHLAATAHPPVSF